MGSTSRNSYALVAHMPKVELHAHLSGSIRERTIRTLLQNPKHHAMRDEAMHLLDSQISLENVFRLFPIIQNLVSDSETLNTVLQEVLRGFAEENTVYIELRTTPRECAAMSAEEYLLTVLRGITQYHATNQGGMVCRVLVSICRHQPVQNARNTEELIAKIIREHEHLSNLIVGFDFSGDPNRGSWNDFEPILQHMRQRFGLPITLHFGEVANETECMRMLECGPDRIGHAAIMSDAVVRKLLCHAPPLGVEVCLTSNMMTTGISDIKHHPAVKYLVPTKHPVCICTDDAGVCRTSLTQEYRHLLSVFPMTPDQITKMALGALDMAFCREEKVMSMVRQNAHRLLGRPPHW